MNELQEAIFEVILSILRNDKLHKKFESYPEQIGKPIFQNSAIRYGILNYVAKFSLANNEYFISEKCFKHISELNLINKKGLRRGKKGTKYKFTFEHPVPSNIIGDLLYENYNDENKVREILCLSDVVTVLTYEEDKLLRESKLVSKMPLGWKMFENDIFERYTKCGLSRPSRKITVYGALAR